MKGSLAPTCEADGVHVMKSFLPGFTSHNSFFPSLRSALLAGVAIAGLLGGSASLRAQTGNQTAPSQTPSPAAAPQQPDAVSAPAVELPANKAEKKQEALDKKAAKKEAKAEDKHKKEDKVVKSKDTRPQARRLQEDAG